MFNPKTKKERKKESSKERKKEIKDLNIYINNLINIYIY